MTTMITVVLCDDHRVVRTGLRLILEAEPDITVVGEAATAEDATAAVATHRPDVVVMDIGLHGTNGIDATRLVRDQSPATRVLVLTMQEDIGYVRQAFAAGATGYLLKDAADVELVAAVRTVSGGGAYVHPSLGAALLTAPEPGRRVNGPGGELTEREEAVLRLIATGHTNAEIAGELFLSVRTVETHRMHLTQKLQRHTRADLVAVARDFGLLEET
ncbi:response regulator transcription factor [Kineosporia sp. R_H_3]|uniref:response regulator n=1 Tax=Kineosporia sp. R_H_3 TaxID=1961848 RepID=UPI000B4BF08F|nr:response regulator transcription factor [Kineosporia sp. R_H_3]